MLEEPTERRCHIWLPDVSNLARFEINLSCKVRCKEPVEHHGVVPLLLLIILFDDLLDLMRC